MAFAFSGSCLLYLYVLLYYMFSCWLVAAQSALYSIARVILFIIPHYDSRNTVTPIRLRQLEWWVCHADGKNIRRHVHSFTCFDTIPNLESSNSEVCDGNLLFCSVVISRPWSRDSSALEFILSILSWSPNLKRSWQQHCYFVQRKLWFMLPANWGPARDYRTSSVATAEPAWHATTAKQTRTARLSRLDPRALIPLITHALPVHSWTVTRSVIIATDSRACRLWRFCVLHSSLLAIIWQKERKTKKIQQQKRKHTRIHM